MTEEHTPNLDQELDAQLADVPEHAPASPTKLVVKKNNDENAADTTTSDASTATQTQEDTGKKGA